MEKDNNKDKKNEADFDLFGLGGLFKGIEKLVDLAGKLDEKGGISKEGEINFDHIKKGMKGVYGFTINTAGGGIPKVETFGNIKKTPEGPKVDEEREPITDIFDEKNEIVVIAGNPRLPLLYIPQTKQWSDKGSATSINRLRQNQSVSKRAIVPEFSWSASRLQ